MAAAAGGGGRLASGAGFGPATNTSASTGVRSASVVFDNDGTATRSSGASQVATSNYYIPAPTPGIGGELSVRLTIASNTNASISGWVSGAWYSLASGRTFTVVNSSSNVEGNLSATVAMSYDGGTTAYNVGTATYIVGYIA